MRLQKLHVFAECGRLCMTISPGDDAGAITVALAWNLNRFAGLMPCTRPRAWGLCAVAGPAAACPNPVAPAHDARERARLGLFWHAREERRAKWMRLQRVQCLI